MNWRVLCGFLGLGLLLFACGAPSEDDAPESVSLEEQLASGRFGKLRSRGRADSLSSEQREKIAQLESIGYVSGSRETFSEQTVPRYDRERATDGYNFYCSGHAPEAYLLDMDGEVLHRWNMPSAKAFPDFVPTHHTQNGNFWRRAVLLDNGDVLGIFEGIGVFRIDRDSNLLWTNRNGAHHDLDVLADGRIVVITRKAHVVTRVHPTEPVLEDFLAVLSPEGVTLSEVSLLECFENSRFVIQGLHDGQHTGDLFHSNGLQVLTGEKNYKVAWMRPGLVIVSMRHISALAIVDMVEMTVVRALRGGFVWQHDPRVLANGDILLFDNRGPKTGSRVLQLDPTDLSVAWQYAGTESDPFFSDTCGMAERLPNGNTMITESDNGRAMEVTPDGDIVWEFYNPHRAGNRGEFIATLFEMRRVPVEACRDWLSR